MSKTRQNDDLTPEEIKDIDDYYADNQGKKRFETAEDLIKWLHS